MAKTDTTHTDFLKFIQEINKGQTVLELGQALEQVVAGVRDTGIKGELVFRLRVKPVGNHGADVDQVTVEDSIVMKIPTRKRKESLFFTTDRNTLQRSNPSQMDFLDQQAQGKQENA